MSLKPGTRVYSRYEIKLQGVDFTVLRSSTIINYDKKQAYGLLDILSVSKLRYFGE